MSDRMDYAAEAREARLKYVALASQAWESASAAAQNGWSRFEPYCRMVHELYLQRYVGGDDSVISHVLDRIIAAARDEQARAEGLSRVGGEPLASLAPSVAPSAAPSPDEAPDWMQLCRDRGHEPDDVGEPCPKCRPHGVDVRCLCPRPPLNLEDAISVWCPIHGAPPPAALPQRVSLRRETVEALADALAYMCSDALNSEPTRGKLLLAFTALRADAAPGKGEG